MFVIKYTNNNLIVHEYGDLYVGDHINIMNSTNLSFKEYTENLTKKFNGSLLNLSQYQYNFEIIFKNKKDAKAAIDWIISLQVLNKLDIENKIPKMEWVQGVPNLKSLKSIYPQPIEGMIVNCLEENAAYIYYSGEWVMISN